MKPITDPASQAQLWLEVLGGPEDGKLFCGFKPEICVGRTNDTHLNDLALNNPFCSRRHALIRRVADHWVLVDRNSENGTMLNGRFIDPTQPQPLHDGDYFSIGPTIIQYHTNPRHDFRFKPSKAPLPGELRRIIDRARVRNLTSGFAYISAEAVWGELGTLTSDAMTLFFQRAGIDPALVAEKVIEADCLKNELAWLKEKMGARSSESVITEPQMTPRLHLVVQMTESIVASEKAPSLEPIHLLVALLREGGGLLNLTLADMGLVMTDLGEIALAVARELHPPKTAARAPAPAAPVPQAPPPLPDPPTVVNAAPVIASDPLAKAEPVAVVQPGPAPERVVKAEKLKPRPIVNSDPQPEPIFNPEPDAEPDAEPQSEPRSQTTLRTVPIANRQQPARAKPEEPPLQVKTEQSVPAPKAAATTANLEPADSTPVAPPVRKPVDHVVFLQAARILEQLTRIQVEMRSADPAERFSKIRQSARQLLEEAGPRQREALSEQISAMLPRLLDQFPAPAGLAPESKPLVDKAPPAARPYELQEATTERGVSSDTDNLLRSLLDTDEFGKRLEEMGGEGSNKFLRLVKLLYQYAQGNEKLIATLQGNLSRNYESRALLRSEFEDLESLKTKLIRDNDPNTITEISQHMDTLFNWQVAMIVSYQQAFDEWIDSHWKEINPSAIEKECDVSGWKKYMKGDDYWQTYKRKARILNPEMAKDEFLQIVDKLVMRNFELESRKNKNSQKNSNS